MFTFLHGSSVKPKCKDSTAERESEATCNKKWSTSVQYLSKNEKKWSWNGTETNTHRTSHELHWLCSGLEKSNGSACSESLKALTHHLFYEFFIFSLIFTRKSFATASIASSTLHTQWDHCSIIHHRQPTEAADTIDTVEMGEKESLSDRLDK